MHPIHAKAMNGFYAPFIRMSKVFKNTFQGGMANDISPLMQPNSTYKEGFNITLRGSNDSLSASSVRGSDNDLLINNFVSDGEYKILGTWDCEAVRRLASEKENAILVAYAYKDIRAISDYTIAVNVVFKDRTFQVFQKRNAGQESLQFTADAAYFSESGIPFAYITISDLPPKKIKLDENDSYDRNLLGDYVTPVTSVSISDGGGLTSGTYQFLYYLIDERTGIKTKPSLPSIPQGVKAEDNFVSVPGSSSGKSIDLTFRVKSEIRQKYTHYRMIVLASTDGLPNAPLSATELPVERLSSTELNTYKYSGNEASQTVPVDKYVVEQSPIRSLRSVEIKDNILFGGGVRYLDLHSGYTPSLVSHNPIYQEDFTSNAFRNRIELNNQQQKAAYQTKGYFRGEVYRFYVCYHDEFGNWGPVVYLDDIETPNRDNRNLFEGSSGTRPTFLGIRLNGVRGHPSWAKGMAIFRAKRDKNIIAQTPLVHGEVIRAAPATGLYPSKTIDNNEDANADIGNLEGTWKPKNLLRSVPKSISANTRNTTPYRQTPEQVNRNNMYYTVSDRSSVLFAYPPELLYNNKGGYVDNDYQDASYLEVIDYTMMPKISRGFSNSDYLFGDYVDTLVSAYFPADRAAYFANGIVSEYEGNSGRKNIVDLQRITALGNGTVLSGSTPSTNIGGRSTPIVSRFSTLQDSWDRGFVPFAQNGFVITLDSELIDPMFYGMPDAFREATFGIDQDYTSNIVSMFPGESFDFNSIPLAHSNTFFSGLTGALILPIANIVAGKGADRYGEPDSFQEVIFTGAYQEFNNDEALNDTAISLDVWGGDCFISLHNFKVNDSAYAITHNIANSVGATIGARSVAEEKYGTIFRDLYNNVHFNIVPLKGVQEVVAVYLESEVNAYFAEASLAAKGPDSGEDAIIKIPMGYQYNLSYSNAGDAKVKFSEPDSFVRKNDFDSRMVYTDTKIYQSQEDAFSDFRVSNFYDLEESMGAISALKRAGDDMYAVQHNGVALVPVNVSVIESADGGIIATRSANVIGKPRYATTEYGSRSPRSVIDMDGGILLVDDSKKDVVSVSRGGAKSITDGHDFTFHDIISPENKGKYFCVKDTINGFIWVGGLDDGNVYGFDTRMKTLSTVLSSDIVDISGMEMHDNTSMFFFKGSALSKEDVFIEEEGATFAQNPIASGISCIVHGDNGLPKVFDNILINMDGEPYEVLCETFRPDGTVYQSVHAEGDWVPVEGMYRIKILRDQNNARLRGVYMKISITFGKNVAIQQVLTKYRLSERSI